MSVRKRVIPNWWAVEAMIASYNHVYQVVYGTTYEDLGAIGVSVYGNAPIAAFQYEFLALSTDPRAVVDAVRAYPQLPDTEHVLDVFLDSLSDTRLISEYQVLGYETIRSGTIMGLELSAGLEPNPVHVNQVKTLRHIELANQSLSEEGEYISPKTLREQHIHTFIVEADEQTAGWAQMVTVHPRVAYLNQLYVMNAFRGRHLGTSLIQRAQVEAAILGMEHIVLVPSDTAMGLCRRLGYRPLVYFTALRPKEAH